MAKATTLPAVGVDCPHCAQRPSESRERAEGVIRAEFDPADAAKVRYDEDRVAEEQLGERIRQAGFDLA